MPYNEFVNFKDAIKTCLKNKYANFSGRASRSEFWFFYLFNIIVYAILLLLIVTVSFKFLWVFGIFVFGIIIPALAVTFRRLHDINKSGWLVFLPFPFEIIGRVPERSSGDMMFFSLVFTFIALGLYIYLFVLYIKDGDKKNNRFGKNIYKKKRKRKRK